MVTGLTPQLSAIVQDALRYRISTAALVRLRQIRGALSLTEATALLESLVAKEWLRRGTLVPGEAEPYYFPGLRLAEACGVAQREFAEPSFEHRVQRLAVAWFCAEPGHVRELMTDEEFRDRFPILSQPGQPMQYYLERVGDWTRLAFLKVDLGGPSQWDRVVDACQRFLANRSQPPRDPRRSRQSEIFRHMIERDRFQVSLLLGSPDKARAVAARLDAERLVSGVRPAIVPYVVPGLLPLALKLATYRSHGPRRKRRRRGRRAKTAE